MCTFLGRGRTRSTTRSRRRSLAILASSSSTGSPSARHTATGSRATTPISRSPAWRPLPTSSSGRSRRRLRPHPRPRPRPRSRLLRSPPFPVRLRPVRGLRPLVLRARAGDHGIAADWRPRMPRLCKALLIAAAVPLVLLAGWQRVIEPALVKIPGDVNRTNNYAGTVSVFVDQKTTIDLPTPQESPMTIVRTAESVPGSTGSTTTSLREIDHINLLGQNVEQSYVFVLDRSSARNVFNEQSTAYGNNVNRRGAYYPNLPF